jgi:hypothetical protein
LQVVAFLARADRPRVNSFSIVAAVQMGIYQEPTTRVLKNKHQAVSQGVRRFGKRSIFSHM